MIRPAFDYSLDFKAINFRRHPDLYRVGKGEQGVLLVEPYKSEILLHWRFKTIAEAKRSSAKIYKMFLAYLKAEDFPGADMARKFLQMGWTRARRYANHKGGRKYDKKTGEEFTEERGQGESGSSGGLLRALCHRSATPGVRPAEEAAPREVRNEITMLNFICTTCGTQYAATEQPPDICAICQDERQYVKATGQQWTTFDKLRLTNRNSIRSEEPGLIGIGVDPQFAIGQRALFVRTPNGNVLWDCVPLLDPAVVEMVNSLGGISAIGISHPHYYSSMVEWSRAFNDVPIYLHAADRQWVMRPDKAINFWEGDTEPLGDGLTLIRCGGHFDGGTVLHWQGGAMAKGALLTGDIIQVVADRKHVSFMYSYPNYVPLSATTVEQIAQAVEPFEYDRLYGAFWDTLIEQNGKAAVARSAERYQRAIRGETK